MGNSCPNVVPLSSWETSPLKMPILTQLSTVDFQRTMVTLCDICNTKIISSDTVIFRVENCSFLIAHINVIQQFLYWKWKAKSYPDKAAGKLQMGKGKLSPVIEFGKDREDISALVRSAMGSLMIHHKGTWVGCIAQLLHRQTHSWRITTIKYTSLFNLTNVSSSLLPWVPVVTNQKEKEIFFLLSFTN